MSSDRVASVQIRGIELVNDNPASFNSPYVWRLTLDVLEPLLQPVGLAFVWVASAQTSDLDVVLDELELGPFNVGLSVVDVEHTAPDPRMIPPDELPQPTFLVMSFSYGGVPFSRVTYFVFPGGYGAEAMQAAASEGGSIPFSQVPPPGGEVDADGAATSLPVGVPADRVITAPDGRQRIAWWPNNAHVARYLGREVRAGEPRLTVMPLDWDAVVADEKVNRHLYLQPYAAEADHASMIPAQD